MKFCRLKFPAKSGSCKIYQPIVLSIVPTGKVHYEQSGTTRSQSRSRSRPRVSTLVRSTLLIISRERSADPIYSDSRTHSGPLIRAGESTKLRALGHASSTAEKPAINGRCVRGRQELIMQVPMPSLRSRDSHLLCTFMRHHTRG